MAGRRIEASKRGRDHDMTNKKAEERRLKGEMKAVLYAEYLADCVSGGDKA